MMNKPTFHDLTLRLECPERQNRRWKRAGALVLAAVVAMVPMGCGTTAEMGHHGAPAGRVVEVEQLVLRDSGGRLRAEVTVTGEGGVRLSLYDLELTARARLEVRGDGRPELSLYDKDGRVIWRAP